METASITKSNNTLQEEEEILEEFGKAFTTKNNNNEIINLEKEEEEEISNNINFEEKINFNKSSLSSIKNEATEDSKIYKYSTLINFRL